MRSTGLNAGNILQRTMAGEIRSRTLRAGLPMLDETNGGRTDIGPMLARLQRARAYERNTDVFAVSINAGFARANIREIGPTVLVTAQGDMAAHQRFADSIADDIWQHRHERINHFLGVDAAAKMARNWPGAGGPLVIADYADNPGGGGYGDATALLKALFDAEVGDACFGSIVDPQAVAQLQGAPVGSKVEVALGGKTDARLGGGPSPVTGTVLLHSDGHYFANGPITGGLDKSWGPTVVLRVDGIDILIVSLPAQILDLAQFTAFGIEPATKKVVALKSMQHFRAAFEPIAGKVIVCDSGALCTPNYASLPFPTRLCRGRFFRWTRTSIWPSGGLAVERRELLAAGVSALALALLGWRPPGRQPSSASARDGSSASAARRAVAQACLWLVHRPGPATADLEHHPGRCTGAVHFWR
jgi:microcystin degradation protein MlrC